MPNEKITPQQIPLEKIHNLPDVSPVKLADKAYGGLVAAILLDGVKEPVILRQREDGEFQLVAGYRRRKAAELAKLKELPALVYDMTEKEAQEYHKIANTSPDAPIPGKLIEGSTKTQAADAKEKKTASVRKEAETTPLTPAKASEEKKAKNKNEAAKADKTEGSPTAKKAETAKPSTPAAEGKTASAAEANNPTPVPDTKATAQNESKEAEPPASKDADVEKRTFPNKPTAKKEPEEKTAGTAAVGPTGTLITKLLGEKLSPPTAKDKKALPVPGDGEAFAVTLHPAYLKKADINTFSVDRSSDDFKELFQSIKRFGVKDPVLARFGKDGELEIISGQRRHLIAAELNYPVPTIIQQLDDDDARILVADGNLHREHISTYDLSRAVKMKSESMKHKVGRRSKFDTGPKKQYTDETIAAEMGMSTAKLNRLMKLSEATKQICDLVDENKIPLSVAYNIAFLTPKVQDTVADLIGINYKVNNENTQTLKKVAGKETLTIQKIKAILEGEYPPKPVEKPKPVNSPVEAAASTPSMAPNNIPKSPDIGPAPTQTNENIASASSVPAASSPVIQPPAISKTAMSAAFETVKGDEGTPDRENSHETKIILRGDRLRKYFPDVSMTPREIEDSVYDALEERRQRQEKAKQKAEIFGKDKKPPVR